MAYFIECARSGRTPIPGGQEGLANTRVTEMAYASARSGQVITASEI
jgi:predicted dehydrogenase